MPSFAFPAAQIGPFQSSVNNNVSTLTGDHWVSAMCSTIFEL